MMVMADPLYVSLKAGTHDLAVAQVALIFELKYVEMELFKIQHQATEMMGMLI
jgi:hypothetical protein